MLNSDSAAPAVGAVLEALESALECAAYLFDAQGRLLTANRFGCNLLGERQTHLVGLTHSEWLRRVKGLYAAYHPEQACELPAGSPELYESRGVPRRCYQRGSAGVQLDGGTGTLEVLRDVTRRIRAEEDVEKLKERHQRQIEALETRLEQIEKYKLELTGNVTHDLRTPLASIRATVSGLLAGDAEYTPAEMRDMIVLIDEETDRLQRRVNNLLSMARLESGTSTLSRDWADLSDIAASAVEAMRSISGKHPVNLDLAEDLPLVCVDYHQLENALRNLLENAFLYSPPEAPVDVKTWSSLDQVRVSVRDYGVGLMPDEFEAVFDKFYRGRNARRIPGTGLGLPICRGIAEAHGGRLWAEHAPGGGVAFVLSIPIPPPTEDVHSSPG
jgi:signal transduction histidine kinase